MTLNEVIDQLQNLRNSNPGSGDLRVRLSVYGDVSNNGVVRSRITHFVSREGEFYEDHPDEPGATKGVVVTDT